MRTPAAVLALGLVATLGCAEGTNLARYGNCRALDFVDSFPTSVATGMGLIVEARATPFAGFGLGYANMTRYGSDDTRFGPVWYEMERGIPIFRYYRIQAYLDHKGRLAGGEPHWWDETYRARGNAFLIIPGFPRDGDYLVPLPGPTEPHPTDLFTNPPWLPYTPAYTRNAAWHFPKLWWWNVANVEVGLVIGPGGLRIGVSALQLIDFVGGIFLLDLALDDVRDFPVLWPDPDATPSYPPAAGAPSAPAPRAP